MRNATKSNKVVQKINLTCLIYLFADPTKKSGSENLRAQSEPFSHWTIAKHIRHVQIYIFPIILFALISSEHNSYCLMSTLKQPQL
uniref:Uncharacterized protein n=1 Tax=Onchocerca volvulus TaxID=6282 RepID=A0A8R1Y417_ONCVO